MGKDDSEYVKNGNIAPTAGARQSDLLLRSFSLNPSYSSGVDIDYPPAKRLIPTSLDFEWKR